MAHKKAGGSSRNGVGIGKDHTIFATEPGRVFFRETANGRTTISVLPLKAAE